MSLLAAPGNQLPARKGRNRRTGDANPVGDLGRGRLVLGRAGVECRLAPPPEQAANDVHPDGLVDEPREPSPASFVPRQESQRDRAKGDDDERNGDLDQREHLPSAGPRPEPGPMLAPVSGQAHLPNLRIERRRACRIPA